MNVTGRAAFSGNPRADSLPKSSPYVGHYRHAPPSPVASELADRLQNLLSRREKTQDAKVSKPLSNLPRDSPFVGTQRHAPQSPKLNNLSPPSPMFLEPAFPMPGDDLPLHADGPLGLFFLDDNMPDLDGAEEEEDFFCLRPLDPYQEECCILKPFPALGLCKPSKSTVSMDQCLPHTTLCQILKTTMTTKMLGSVLCVSQAFADAAKSPLTWQGIPVSLPPSAVLYADEIANLCSMWMQASKIVMPRCSELFADLMDTCPDVPIQIAWRFDGRLKGSGIVVKNNGTTACKANEDKVVVLGDAPIRNSYFEILIDERNDDLSWKNAPNDFGLGVTTSRAQAKDQMNKVDVAGELPHSWVIDFSKSSIFLVINNDHAAEYDMFGAEDIRKGDRVGLLVEPQAIRVYVNGNQEASLKVPENAAIEGLLYPVFDLHGRTTQMTRSVASRPSKGRL